MLTFSDYLSPLDDKLDHITTSLSTSKVANIIDDATTLACGRSLTLGFKINALLELLKGSKQKLEVIITKGNKTELCDYETIKSMIGATTTGTSFDIVISKAKSKNLGFEIPCNYIIVRGNTVSWKFQQQDLTEPNYWFLNFLIVKYGKSPAVLEMVDILANCWHKHNSNLSETMCPHTGYTDIGSSVM